MYWRQQRAVEHRFNWQFGRNWSGFFLLFLFFCFFSFLWFLHVFQGSGFFLFTSYFSRSSTMDVFPTMGRHILTSHASIIYSLAFLSEIHFPVLDQCMKLVRLSYYVWKQSNISTWNCTVLQNIVYAAHFFVAWSGNFLRRFGMSIIISFLSLSCIYKKAFYCKYHLHRAQHTLTKHPLLSMASQT